MDTLSKIINSGVIAILRSDSPERLPEIFDALYGGGIVAVEVTMTTPGAMKAIEVLASNCPEDATIGAGSVLDAETARAAILSGASFIVSPITDEDTIRLCKRYGVVVCPGGLTPTEIVRAWELGGDIVKVFPAMPLGPQYVKSLKAPLPQIRLMPTGGVTPDNASDFIRAGACVVGAGGRLIDMRAVSEGRLDAITRAARRIIEEVRKGRGEG